MGDRQATPDVLGQVMSGIALEEKSHKAINTASNKKTAESSSIRHSENVENLKEKATFNLPIKILEGLEDRWMKIRKIVGSKQISKTLIVEKALEIAFEEFDIQKQESKLYFKLASDKTIRQ